MMKRVVLLMMLLLATPVFAGKFGIHFVGNADSKMAADAEAGETDVTQKHWNNLSINDVDPNGHNNRGALPKVTDDAGKSVSGATVEVKATEKTQLWGKDAANWGFTGGDEKLHLGMAYPQPKIIVKSIPYKKYDVYVYLTAGENGGSGSVKISVTTNAPGKVDEKSQYFYKLAWSDGKYVRAESQKKDEADTSNYVRFEANTAKSFTLDIDGKLAGGWTGVAGVQVVEVK